MAKKKKKKRTYTPPDTSEAPKPAAAKAPVRRERKDEARREKEKQLRRWRRRELLRRVVTAVVVVGAIGLVVGFIVSRSRQGSVASAAIQKWNREYPAASKAAGCGEITDVGPYAQKDADHAHIDASNPAPRLDTYASVPPASGPHYAEWLGAGVYSDPQDILKMIHSLEHGGVIVWYSPTLKEQQLQPLQDFVKEHQDHAIMAPYDYPDQGSASQIPEGKKVALVAWHFVQLCDEPAANFDAVLANFFMHYRDPTLGGQEFNGAPDIESGGAV